ncbi:phosphatidate cytidylyltransferase [Chromatiaceae bacterium AAb-1]|nr:phosphatidate cytidylyltransferase [Chromatiaceae bacterium AAb-1]
MFKQRVITAILLAPLALAAVFFLPLPGFALFVSCAFLLGAWEWSGFCNLPGKAVRLGYVALTAVLLAVLYVFLPQQLHWPLSDNVLTSGLLLSGIGWWIFAIFLVLTFPKTQPLWASSDWLRALMGWLTLIPAWTGILFLRAIDYDVAPFTGAWLICVLLGIVWAADIGGYIVGKPFGRTKLLPKVSPGKTLEGMLGGILLVLLLITAIAAYLNWPEQIFAWYVAALLLTVLSVFGDLTESMFKRVAGVKDSGAFLPGHGGILDRIDSLTATAPLFALIVACYGGFH